MENITISEISVEFFSKLHVAKLKIKRLCFPVANQIIGINLLLCEISGVQSTICKSVVENEINSFKIDHIQRDSN